MKSIENKTIIYIIDDDQLFLRIMETKFRNMSRFKVLTFSSGEEFLDYLKKNNFSKSIFQIAITDYNFLSKVDKQMNGVELIKKIKKINPHIKVILTTQQDDKTLINEALSIDPGSISFVPKNEESFELFLDEVRYYVSEHTVKILKKRKLISQTVFFSTLFIGIIMFLIFGFD